MGALQGCLRLLQRQCRLGVQVGRQQVCVEAPSDVVVTLCQCQAHVYVGTHVGQTYQSGLDHLLFGGRSVLLCGEVNRSAQDKGQEEYFLHALV